MHICCCGNTVTGLMFADLAFKLFFVVLSLLLSVEFKCEDLGSAGTSLSCDSETLSV